MTREQAKKYLKTLLRINSIESDAEEGKPFGKGVYDCLCTALDILEKEGFRVKNGDGYYGYGEIGEGELFGILTHLDVVPVGSGWTKAPFEAEECDGKIYARGALDDKSPFVACLYAVCRILNEGLTPKKRIRFILGCDEESGWKCMEEYSKKEEMPKIGISPDGDFPVINCEKGIVYHKISYSKSDFIISLTSGERANMVPDYAEASVKYSEELINFLTEKQYRFSVENEIIKIKTTGVSAHGSHPEDGENALLKLLGILSDYDCVCNEVFNAFKHCYGRGIGLEISDTKSGKLTLNLGTARTTQNKIIFELDIRHPVEYKKEYISEKLKEQLSGEVTETFFHLPLYVDKEHSLVKTLLNAYNKVTGEQAEPISIGGGTYARVLPLGVAFGPCFPNSTAGIHCADEYIDMNEFFISAEIYYEALKSLCF